MDAQVSKLYLGFSLGMGMFVFSMITSYGVTYPKFIPCLCFPGRRPGRRAHLPRKSLEDVNPFRRIGSLSFFSYNLRLPGFCVGGVHVFQDGFRTSSRKTQAFGTCTIYRHTRSLSKSIIVSVKADQMSTGTYLFRSSGFMQEASKLEHIFKVSPSRTTVGGIYSSHSASAPFPIFQC